MSGTVRMGTSSVDACVDSRFRVFGLRSLRVVDMSVVPFVPRYVRVVRVWMKQGILIWSSCHTQSTAYILGELASDVLLEEYDLGVVEE